MSIIAKFETNLFRTAISIQKALMNPRLIAQKIKHKFDLAFLWEKNYLDLKAKKHHGGFKLGLPEKIDKVCSDLRSADINVLEYAVDISKYETFLKKANYSKYPHYHFGGTDRDSTRKKLEHFIAADLLDLNEKDIYIDIASMDSPAADIYADVFRSTNYKQDLLLSTDINKRIIGGNACQMPVDDDFADKMALHCSFEHFENDNDIEFIKEASRVLAPGGKMCIVPLYLYSDYAIFFNPGAAKKGVIIEEDAEYYCLKGWRSRFGRVYDVTHLAERIRTNLKELELTVVHITNVPDIIPSGTMRFAALFEKK